MSSTREYESHNVLFPLKNSTGMVAQANILVSTAGIVQNLASLFRGIGDGHFVTAAADGAKLYAAWGSNDVGQTLMLGLTGYAIEPGAVGVGRQVCFPIPDGVMLPGVPYGGTESGRPTGHAGATTLGMTIIDGYNFVHARVASGGVPTAYLRLYRSSLAPNQNVREFKPV